MGRMEAPCPQVQGRFGPGDWMAWCPVGTLVLCASLGRGCHLLRSQAGHTPMASKGFIHEVDGEPSQGDGVRPWTEMKEWSQEALGMALS